MTSPRVNANQLLLSRILTTESVEWETPVSYFHVSDTTCFTRISSPPNDNLVVRGCFPPLYSIRKQSPRNVKELARGYSVNVLWTWVPEAGHSDSRSLECSNLKVLRLQSSRMFRFQKCLNYPNTWLLCPFYTSLLMLLICM